MFRRAEYCDIEALHWTGVSSAYLLPMTWGAPVIAARAASFTCFLVSDMQGVTSGTTRGRAWPSCSGALSLKLASVCRYHPQVLQKIETVCLLNAWLTKQRIAAVVAYIVVAAGYTPLDLHEYVADLTLRWLRSATAGCDTNHITHAAPLLHASTYCV